jgi:hypothetical protein
MKAAIGSQILGNLWGINAKVTYYEILLHNINGTIKNSEELKSGNLIKTKMA